MDYEPSFERNLETPVEDRIIFPLRESLTKESLKIEKISFINNIKKENTPFDNIQKSREFDNNRLPRLRPFEYIDFRNTMNRFADLYPQVRGVEVPRLLDRDQAVRIGEAVDGLAVVRQAFGSTPKEELDLLLKQVERSLTERGDQERRKLIVVLFSSLESTVFAAKIQADGIKVDQLPDLFFNDGIFSLVSVMLEHPEKYRMQLGVILSQVDFDKIPEDLRKKLKPIMSGLEFSLRTEHGDWFLCGDAELRLMRSIEEGSSIAIGEKGNPYFLVKFRGKMSALCLQDFTTRDGKVFIRGNWYSPTDDTRNDLQKAFDEGKGRVVLEKGSWALMRPVKAYREKSEEEIIAEALLYAKTLPDIYPNDEITARGTATSVKRREFRRLQVEED